MKHFRDYKKKSNRMVNKNEIYPVRNKVINLLNNVNLADGKPCLHDFM